MSAPELPPGSLQNLNDIVLPAAVPWWPLAPGWYVLGAVLALAACWYGFRLLKRWKSNRYRRSALAELRQLRASGDVSIVSQVPALLKRTALAAFPREEVASLSGLRWIEFLQRTGGKATLEPGAGMLLQRAAYGTMSLTGAECEQLFTAAERWISRHDNGKD